MSRKLSTFCMIATTVILGSLIFHQRSVLAQADPLCVGSVNIGGQNLPYCKGYFNGSNHNNTVNVFNSHQVLSTGIGNTSQSGFEDEMQCYLFNDATDAFCAPWRSTYGVQNQTGAAFIVDGMLGHAPFNSTVNTGVGYATSNFAKWILLVNAFYTGSVAGYSVSITGNICIPNSMNSAYFDGYSNNGVFQAADDAFHISDCTNGLDSSPLLVFTSPAGNFDIGTLCGNIEVSDKVTQLQTSLSCGITTSPTQIDPDTKFSVIVTVSVSSGSPPTGVPVTLTFNPAVPSTYTNPQLTNSSSQATFSSVGPILGNGGTYTATATLSGGYTGTCNLPIAVGNLPYLQVYGGDVSVTGSPELTYTSGNPIPDPGCENPQPSNPSAGIFAWNNNGVPDYAGAGSQYAVFALGEIDGFASDQASTLSAPLAPPTALSFAYPGPSGSGPFGGAYGAADTTANCNFTYDCLFNTSGGSFSTTNCPNKLPICNVFCTTLDTGNGSPYMIVDNKTKTIFTFGSIYITNNIEYQQPPGGWTSPAEIPNFRLVVLGGNIYIGPKVTELDGLYVAEPSNNNKKGTWVGGSIYTCATGSLQGKATPTVSPTLIANYDSTCGEPLSIYGAFVAQQVEFLRTHGSLGGASTATNNPSCMVLNGATGQNTCNAAETFEYSPELWLPRNTNAANNNYTSISGLPPVL